MMNTLLEVACVLGFVALVPIAFVVIGSLMEKLDSWLDEEEASFSNRVADETAKRAEKWRNR